MNKLFSYLYVSYNHVSHLNILRTFRALIDNARMDHLLTDDNGNFTIFAPDNSAFDNMDSNRIEKLINNKQELRRVSPQNAQLLYTQMIQ